MEDLPPVTCSLGVIGPLLGKLYSLMLAEESLPEEVSKDELQSLIQDLEETRNSMVELSKEENPSFTAKCLMKEMREICYDAEDYLNTVLHSGANDPEEDVSDLRVRLQGARKRHERCQEVGGLKARLQQDARERHQRCQFVLDGFQTLVKSMLETPHEVLEKPMGKLIDLLAFGSEQQLKVVAIFGPAGVGKTTLARIFYHRYGGSFQCRAFLQVSPNPDTRRFLTSMLSQIKAPRPQASCGVQDLTNKVNNHLRGKTYLIVVDGIWDTSAWDIISRAFPEDGRYSRIITTTQLKNVALACCSYCSNNIYEMQPLSYGQPQELFYGTSERTKDVINLMYNNLPAHLKTCLLYLSMYPEDYVIRKDDLVKQWVAEGFIGVAKREDMEEVAISYFDELVTRGMIQTVDTNYKDEVLSFTVHHMVLDHIACKSMEENFITVIEYFETMTGLADKVRRLSLKFGGAKNGEIPGSLRMSHVRSLLFSGFFRCVPSIVKYRLLRVLILDVWADDGDRTSFDLTGIHELFLLRYLKVACNVAVTLPEQMDRLQFLETLEVDARVDAFPSGIVLLQRLWHLRLPGGTALPHGISQMKSLRTLGYLDLSKNPATNIGNLTKLTNLHDLQFTCSMVQSDDRLFGNNLAMFRSHFEKLSSLKSLTLVPGLSHGSTTETSPSSMSISCDGLSVVPSPPDHLQKLDLFPKNCIISEMPKWIKRLDKLCCLKIAVKELSLTDMDCLKKLLTLTSLSLHVRVAPSNSIVIDQEGFQVLRYLTFRCALFCLTFRNGSMPNIQRLKLGFCGSQEGLSSCGNAGLEHLSSLKEISAKLWPAGAGAGDVNTSVAESCLKAATSKSVSRPIVNIKCVDWTFYGEKYQSQDDFRSIKNSPSESSQSQLPGLTRKLTGSCAPTFVASSMESVVAAYSMESVVAAYSMESVVPDDGDDGVMVASKHIVKSPVVSDSDNATDNMMRFLSLFDPRMPPLSSPVEEDEYGDKVEEEEEIAAAEEVIRRCNFSSGSSSMIGMSDYLCAVDDAIAAAGHSARAAAAVQAAMPRLEEEVCSLLSASLSTDGVDDDDEGTGAHCASPRHAALFPDAIASVRGIADRMIRAGYGQKLVQVFVSVRRDALAESLALLGVEAVAMEEVIRMEWTVLEQKTRRWSHAIRVVVRSFLARERQLRDEVFELDKELGHECLADVASGCVLQLLAFADAVAVSAPATEKLYLTLGMYEALTEVQPELEALFSGDAAREILAGEVSSTVEQLGSAVQNTVKEFGRFIHGETSRNVVHGGEIHPMTRYVLNYCGLLADFRGTLDKVLSDSGLDNAAEASTTDGGAASAPSARCFRELVKLLLGKIDEKSRLYDDVGLQNIFLMNNLHYVVQKVRESTPLRELLGDDWLRRHRGQIRQYEAAYLRASWMAVLCTLLRRDDDGSAAGPSAKGFNAAFEELYRAQTAWKVTDPELREELRISVWERLVPAYRAFLGQWTRHPARHVKCSVEDLENYLMDFFEGVPKSVRW